MPFYPKSQCGVVWKRVMRQTRCLLQESQLPGGRLTPALLGKLWLLQARAASHVARGTAPSRKYALDDTKDGALRGEPHMELPR